MAAEGPCCAFALNCVVCLTDSPLDWPEAEAVLLLWEPEIPLERELDEVVDDVLDILVKAALAAPE